ncbi:MAG: DegT/DnrJ/EryC1/StrS family aminotransferase [Planctomycetota bacterium]
MNPNAQVPLLNIVQDNQPHREAFLEAIAEVLDSGRFLFGPDVAALEEEIAAYSQVPHAVGCASGSDALLLSLMALDIGPGDEVIVPSFTFFASVSCITRLGATPVFVDIRPDTYNMDVQRFAEAITDKTRAVIPVHLFGQCAEMDRLVQIAGQHDIAVIEDAAQAIGAAYHSRPAGSWGLTGCISFYPTKNLGGMGDGGMLTSGDAAMADRLRLFAGHGMRPRYYHKVVGINSRLDTFQAAVLRIKFAELEKTIEARCTVAERYDRLFAESGLIESQAVSTPYRDPAARHVWNQYSLRVPGGHRDSLRAHMADKGVSSEIYYPVPVHQQECYAYLGQPRHCLDETNMASAEILHLPVFPSLTAHQQSIVVETVGDYFAKSQRLAA